MGGWRVGQPRSGADLRPVHAQCRHAGRCGACQGAVAAGRPRAQSSAPELENPGPAQHCRAL
ncbi:MAG: 2Fe-2S iron-sulfur cluster-binding protein [Novosphingobium sp.]